MEALVFVHFNPRCCYIAARFEQHAMHVGNKVVEQRVAVNICTAGIKIRYGKLSGAAAPSPRASSVSQSELPAAFNKRRGSIRLGAACRNQAKAPG